MERNCQKCIHHISGLCCKWDCEMTTLEDYRNKVIDEFINTAITRIVAYEFQAGYLNSKDCESIFENITEQMREGD